MNTTRFSSAGWAVFLFAGWVNLAAASAPDAPSPAVLNADSCEAVDVQAAIDIAGDGDTVRIPPGTCSWGTGVSFRKGIHLTGGSLGAVTLIHDAGGEYLLEVTEDATHLTEISHLRFVEGSGFADAHIIVHPGGRPLLVHNNYFETNGRLTRSISWSPNRGVIWHNRFYSNGQDDGAIVFVDNFNETSWSTPSTMGMDDLDGESNVYVERNLFRELPLQALDPDSNSRVVIRRNFFYEAAMASHGADTSEHGTRHWEIYDNRFTFTDHGDCDGSMTAPLDYFFFVRGGTGIIADNRFPDIDSCAWGDKSEIKMTVMNIRLDAGPYPCWTTYPAPRQIGQSHDGTDFITDPVHIWGNTGGGAYGLSDYEPDTCGNGETVTDYIQEGRDFVLGPRPGYTKYIYPHPLRALAWSGIDE